MENITYESFISITAILIALLSLWLTRVSIKKANFFHIESFLLQLIDIKATEVNETYRNNKYELDAKTASHIVSILISYRECVELILSSKSILIDKDKFSMILFLQLHTDIRIHITENKFLDNDNFDPIFKTQIDELKNMFNFK